MRFWAKIGFLGGVTYLACYVSFLVQDRQEHHAVVREVEAATRAASIEATRSENPAEIHDQLSIAQQRFLLADARWRSHASHLLLLSN